MRVLGEITADLKTFASTASRLAQKTKEMTVSLHGIDGQQIFKVELPPEA
jgi:hypothetical protein